MVMTVVAILAGITFGITAGVRNSQNKTLATADLAEIARGLEQFKTRYGDYPQIASTTDTANANLLLRALTGWTILQKNASGVPTMVPVTTPRESFVDASRFTLSAALTEGAAPTGDVYILDPWDQPYIYIYNVTSPSWDNFGYVLLASGADEVASLGSAATDGLIDQAWKEAPANIDNIYLEQ